MQFKRDFGFLTARVRGGSPPTGYVHRGFQPLAILTKHYVQDLFLALSTRSAEEQRCPMSATLIYQYGSRETLNAPPPATGLIILAYANHGTAEFLWRLSRDVLVFLYDVTGFYAFIEALRCALQMFKLIALSFEFVRKS